MNGRRNRMSYSPSLRKARMAQVVDEIRRPSPLSSTRRDHDTASAGTQASEIQPLSSEIETERAWFALDPSVDSLEHRPPVIPIPDFWSKGALLNVRNRGTDYCITLYPEEFDPRHPERAMTFPNSWTCQDFVSSWYARENPDPRAR